jgi:precorrin-6A/cobalt-precorrin-6A reductase
MVAAKLAAARALGVPVVLLRRPPSPAVPTVTSVDDALRWAIGRLGAREAAAEA